MTILYSDNFDATAAGSTPTGWTSISGNWAARTDAPVSGSHTKSFGDTTNTVNDVAVLTGGPAARADMEVSANQVVTFNNGYSSVGLGARMDANGQNGYLLTSALQSGKCSAQLYKRVGGTYTALNGTNGVGAFTPASTAAGSKTTLGLRLNVTGSTIKYKVWDASQSEPASWTGTLNDTSITASGYGSTYCSEAVSGQAVGITDYTLGDGVSASVTIAPNALGIVYSPANWNVQTAAATTINGGARMRTLFTGASCTLNFDLSKMVAAAQSKIRYRIDGEHNPWNYVTLTSGNASLACAMPSDTLAYPVHLLEVDVVSTTEFQAPAGTSGQRWDPGTGPNTAVVLTGLTLASGGAVSSPSVAGLKGLLLGDSITEGYLTVNASASADTDRSDSTLGWAFALGRLLGAEIGVVGFGGQAWGAGGVGGVPAFPNTWSNLYSGVARSLAGLDFIAINMGENDGTNAVTATITSTLNAILAAAPATCALYVMRPFSGKQAANLQAAIAATTTPARFAYLDTTGLFDTTQSVDGQHPNGAINASVIAPGVAALIRSAAKPPLVTPAASDTVSLLRSDGSTATAKLSDVKAFLNS